jgi:hypothetical protein
MYAPCVPAEPAGGSARDLPEWYMPPEMIGGYVTGPIVIARSDGLVVAARQVLAFPVGVQIEIEAHGWRALDVGAISTSQQEHGNGADLRFSLRFSDGSEAVQDDEAGLRSGSGPTLVTRGSECSSSGGLDKREDVRLTLWAWPLPPSGPVTLTCSSPRYGLSDASILLDADAIRAAARRAEPFWPAAGA